MTRWPLLERWIGGEATFLVSRDRFDREFAAWRDRGRKTEDLLRRQDVAVALDWRDAPHPGRTRPMTEQRD